MDAREEDGVARAKEVVRAVAMMDVPVEMKTRRAPSASSACCAATATLLKRQKPDVVAPRA